MKGNLIGAQAFVAMTRMTTNYSTTNPTNSTPVVKSVFHRLTRAKQFPVAKETVPVAKETDVHVDTGHFFSHLQ